MCVLQSLSVIKGGFPTQPDLPLFKSQYEQVSRDARQAKDVGVVVRIIVEGAMVDMRLTLEVGDATARAIVIIGHCVNAFKSGHYCVTFDLFSGWLPAQRTR